MRLVLGRVSIPIAAGLVLGLAGSWWATRFIAPLLFEVDARDLATSAGTAAVLVTVAAMAACVPARRAAQVDPVNLLWEG